MSSCCPTAPDFQKRIGNRENNRPEDETGRAENRETADDHEHEPRDDQRGVGGKGGGKPDLAQAGGKDPHKIDEALAAAPDAIRSILGAVASSK